MLSGVPLETFFKALDWLKTRPEVDPKALGVVGYSKGAEAALLVASRRPDVHAVVAAMPSSVSWGGFGIMSLVTSGWSSSWTEGGENVPSLGYGSSEHPKGYVYGLHAKGLLKLGEHAKAIIPVERINAPILMVCGDKDLIWPSCEMAQQVQVRLRQRGKATANLLSTWKRDTDFSARHGRLNRKTGAVGQSSVGPSPVTKRRASMDGPKYWNFCALL